MRKLDIFGTRVCRTDPYVICRLTARMVPHQGIVSLRKGHVFQAYLVRIFLILSFDKMDFENAKFVSVVCVASSLLSLAQCVL